MTNKTNYFNRFSRGLVSVVALGVALGAGASASDLREALAAAYASNPELDAQRAQVRVVDEGVNRARSQYFPTINGTYNRSEGRLALEDANGNLGPNNETIRESYGVSVNQNIFRGFRTHNEIQQAKAQVFAARAQLATVEQRILQQAVTAYMDVLRDEATYQLNQNNVQVLQRQLQASQDRFRVGEVTRTDVAQSEARLELARGQLLTAEAQLETSRAAYERVIGQRAEGLTKPSEALELPASLQDAFDIALENAPQVVAALQNERAANYGVHVAKGALLPSVGANASVTFFDNAEFFGAFQQVAAGRNATVALQVTVPLYAGGSRYSDVRRAKQQRSQRMLEIRNAERLVREGVLVAWNNFRAAVGQIASNQAQVRANEIALEGVRQEASVGSRTTLDVLNAEQELLNSRVSLVRAERDHSVASYSLLSSLGRLTAKDLGLDVAAYNPDENFKDVKNQLIGF